jgi:predicted Zn-dependent peptidase
VARARAQHKVGLLMSLESSSARVEQLGRQMLIYGRPLGVDEMVRRIDAVDAAAVRRVARRVLESGRPSLAALGPIGRLENYDRVTARFAR